MAAVKLFESRLLDRLQASLLQRGKQAPRFHDTACFLMRLPDRAIEELLLFRRHAAGPNGSREFGAKAIERSWAVYDGKFAAAHDLIGAVAAYGCSARSRDTPNVGTVTTSLEHFGLTDCRHLDFGIAAPAVACCAHSGVDSAFDQAQRVFVGRNLEGILHAADHI